MDIISKDHLTTIEEINRITNYEVYYGGSLEDYLLLGESEKPIGDLDVIIYDHESFNKLNDYYNLPNGVPSYFNRMMSLSQIKHSLTLENGIKVDFMLITNSPFQTDDYTSSIYKGILIPHLKFDKKVNLLKEWISLSVPNDMWAYDKFSKILKKYEDIDN